MKVNILLDMELTEEDTRKLENNVLEFCRKNIDIRNIHGSCKIVEANIHDSVPIRKCGFPEELSNIFYGENIFLLNNFSDFTYTQLCEYLNANFTSSRACDYIDIIYRAMKKHNISFKDIHPNDFIPIKDCGFTIRSFNALTRAGFIFLQDVAAQPEEEIKKIRNFGVHSKNELEEKLKEHGLWYND